MKIAISGKSGCGNTTVSRLTAEKLGLRLINYTFRTMAREKKMDFDEMCRLAQQDSSYDIYLDKRQKELAQDGNCVLGSRLAIWLLDDADFKVYLYASVKIRAERVHKREGGDYSQVLEKTIRRDMSDTRRFKELYNIDNESYDFADLIIDVSSISAEETVDIILNKAAMLS